MRYVTGGESIHYYSITIIKEKWVAMEATFVRQGCFGIFFYYHNGLGWVFKGGKARGPISVGHKMNELGI